MKIRYAELERLAAREGYGTGRNLIKCLGYPAATLGRLKRGCRPGYSLVKDMYNRFGREKTAQAVDFEGGSIGEFESRFLLIGKRLY